MLKGAEQIRALNRVESLEWKVENLKEQLLKKFTNIASDNSTLSTFHFQLYPKRAFTLAEVLITLGVIGVVAAITMPVLIQNHRKTVVETRLKKFYSTMNQAVRMSEIDNGPCETWERSNLTLNKDADGSQSLIFYNTYLAKYLKTSSIEKTEDNINKLTLADGSAITFRGATHGLNITFYPLYKTEQFFAFTLLKSNTIGNKCLIEPYTYQWDGTREGLKQGMYGCCNPDTENQCRGDYCTKLIQLNSWKIPKDYPHRF